GRRRGGGAGPAGQDRADHREVGQGPQAPWPPLRRPAEAEVPAPALHELPAVADMEPLITGPLARVLDAHRARSNSPLAQARHDNPQLDADSFVVLLREVAAPLLAEVERVAPERV